MHRESKKCPPEDASFLWTDSRLRLEESKTMSRIQNVFAQLREKNERALIPFITAGDPDIRTTDALLKCFVDNGADCIELGIPFSDPMADGPTIQRASERALHNGFSFASILQILSRFRRYSDVPVILFGYYNPFLQYGIKPLVADAFATGADGFLVVDLPPEEADDMLAETAAIGMDMIFLLAPNSTEDRIELVAEKASGFIYLVSVTGVTGERDGLDLSLIHI